MRNSRGVLGRSLGGEAAVARDVEQERTVGGQLPVSGGHENHELRHGRLVQEVLVRVLALAHHATRRPGGAVLLQARFPFGVSRASDDECGHARARTLSSVDFKPLILPPLSSPA